MWLLAGLGNPGPAYQGHRHNIGFMALDRIVQRHGLAIAAWRKHFQGETQELTIGPEKILALKPQTFMNDSGLSVQAAAQFYKIPLDHIAVLHDDLDLELGRVEVKRGGGHGGHNGLKSIDAHLGSEYWRIRLGIGHPGHTLPREIKQQLVLNHVLGNFSKAEAAAVQPVLEALAEQFPGFLAGEPMSIKEGA
jgi:PTH1 family peptidyl-tRNA hydrolase